MNARWIRAGGRTLLPFTADAISLIARASKGIPRVINSICDNALTNAFGANMKTVDTPQILDVVNDLQIAVPAEVVKAALANGAGAKSNGTRHVPAAETVTAGIAPAMSEEPVPTTFRSLERYMPKQSRTPRRWLRWGTS